MRLTPLLAIALVALLSFLTGCSGENKPSGAEISAALAAELPDHLSVTSFDIEAMENTGSEVDPNYIARFKATMETQSSLYEPDGSSGEQLFLKEVTTAGHSTELFGKSSSVLFQGGWRHDLLLDGNPVRSLGRPLASFAPKPTLIRGSDEEKAYFAELEAANAEFNAIVKDLPIAEMITEFYDTKGEWAGRFALHEVIASRNEKRSNEEFIVHAKYSYRSPQNTTPEGDDRRTFIFRKVNAQWQVTKMGFAGSGKI